MWANVYKSISFHLCVFNLPRTRYTCGHQVKARLSLRNFFSCEVAIFNVQNSRTSRRQTWRFGCQTGPKQSCQRKGSFFSVCHWKRHICLRVPGWNNSRRTISETFLPKKTHLSTIYGRLDVNRELFVLLQRPQWQNVLHWRVTL